MSKGGMQNSDTDWDSVTVLKKRTPQQKTLRSQADINAAQRSGAEIETTKKFDAGSNKQHVMTKSAAKLDAETEDFHHDHVGLDVGRLIQQGRQAKEWSQKDLATKINEKQQVVNEYESGKAIPNQQVLGKIERCLGIRLRGKEKGQPLPQKPQK